MRDTQPQPLSPCCDDCTENVTEVEAPDANPPFHSLISQTDIPQPIPVCQEVRSWQHQAFPLPSISFTPCHAAPDCMEFWVFPPNTTTTTTTACVLDTAPMPSGLFWMKMPP